jgi:pilus assembly protein CpaC
MKFFKFKFVFLFFISILSLNAYDINDKVIYQKDFENKTIYLPINNYRTLVFDDRIKNIQLTNSENITAEFIDSKNAPLRMLKVLGKNIGSESAVVILENNKLIQINFSIMKNLDNIITIVKSTYPNLIIQQANDTIILKGHVKNYREKDTVIDIFKKAGVEIENQLVDMIETSSPSKMIKIKLYAVEINNDEGMDIKNNWTLSRNNYYQATDDTGKYYNLPIDGSVYDSVNGQRNKNLDDALKAIVTSAVSLSGGLTGAANYLGKYFNTSLVLQYLSTEGVANVLDETTLVTLENKNATFHAGGTIMIKVQTTTAEGLPTSTIEPIDYGLQLDFKAKNIMNDEFIDLEIDTKSTDIDWTNTDAAEGLYSFIEKKLKTNVLAQNGHTIVLGGLINNENSNTVNKIPLLGDIPVLGKLFTSTAFNEGKSELVFFVTPIIVDPSNNNQDKFLQKTRKTVLDTSKYKDSIFFSDDKDSKDTEKDTVEVKKDTKKVPTHKEIVDSLYGK